MSDRVQTIPPPLALEPELDHAVRNALTVLPADVKAVLMLVGTADAGKPPTFNLTYAARHGRGWETRFWVGKTYGTRVEGGVEVIKTWKR